MLSHVRIRRYKSLKDVSIKLEPLTVFIGPNGSGKSSICEAIQVASSLYEILRDAKPPGTELSLTLFRQVLEKQFNSQDVRSKFWHGEFEPSNPGANPIDLGFACNGAKAANESLVIPSAYVELPRNPLISKAIHKIVVYDFNPVMIAADSPPAKSLNSSGQGIAYALADILLDDRDTFEELERRLTELVPNIAGISLKRNGERISLSLIDKYSEYHIPARDISDGTLRILAFLTALYQKDRPSIVCFEEPENGIHPWLLHKIVELLNLVSTEGVAGQSVQVLITTHSVPLLNYVKPEQIRAVELDKTGATQVHELPVDTARFEAAMEAYDHEVGSLWFTDVFGGNPA
jgi:predicted ATPase